MFPFDIHFILADILGYQLSLIELLGTGFGIICVVLTAKEHVWCWPAGMVNCLFFFLLFYQLELYPDMGLQVFFLATTIYGWWKWTHPGNPDMGDSHHRLKIKFLSARFRTAIPILIIPLAVGLGFLTANIHLLVPAIFPEPAAFPFPTAFTCIASIAAQLMLTRKKIEAWILWIIVDAVCVAVYLLRGVYLISLEYAAFGVIAVFGLANWLKIMKGYDAAATPGASAAAQTP